jgi:glycosyltransferase involved in cell wall biosynthesis
MQIALIADHIGSLAPPVGAEAGQATDVYPEAYPDDPTASILALARALAGLEHQVTIYARRDSAGRPESAELCPGVTVEYLIAGPQARLRGDQLLSHIAAFADGLADRWQRSMPAVAHAQTWTSGMAALAAARGAGLPVVQSFRQLGPDPADSPRQVRQAAPRLIRSTEEQVRLQAAVGRSAHVVLARAEAEITELVRLGIPQASVKVVPAGVDTGQFRPSGPAARRDGRPRLITVAPLAERRELAAVLQALTRVPEAELVIAGGPGRDELGRDRGYRAVNRMASRLGVPDRLVFTGRVSRAEAPALLRSADLLVSMTAAAPFGVVALDAMACGLPVIAVAAGLHLDVVIDKITGYLVPPEDSRLLADRVNQLLASPMLREGYGIAAASRAKDRYSWPRIGAETLAVYESLARPADATT